MRRYVLILAIAFLCLLLAALAAGCAAGRQAARAPGPAPTVELRIPAIEGAELDIEAEGTPAAGQALPQPELRFSPAEEARGRWLNLFELNLNPAASAGLPPAGDGESGTAPPGSEGP